MSRSTVSRHEGQLGSLMISALFVLAGVVTIWDTTSYTDRDSQVFPQTVAVILIVTASISFVTRFLKPTEEGGFGQGVWWRRVLLICTMFFTCIMMPIIGFLPAGVIAFGGGLVAAMHERWTVSTILVYCGSGMVIMVAFFSLFKYVLYVPLP